MRSFLSLLMWLGGCAPSCEEGQCSAEVELSASTVGECEGLCATVVVRHGERELSGVELGLESDVDGALFGSHMQTDGDGRAEVCIGGPLSPGAHRISAPPCAGCASEEVELWVEPFGGLDRPTEPLEELPWVPEITGLSEPALLRPAEDSWDSVAAMAPSVLDWQGQQLVYYAGADEEQFSLGIALRNSEEEALRRWEGSPLVELQEGEGSWNQYGQQAPHALVVGEEVWLYYTGASLSDGGLHIGLATSRDGLNFVNHPDNPILAPTGEIGDFDWRGVAHASVLQREDRFEMWYASGTLAIGYAVSTDGLSFERYCGNPVFEGLEEEGWDRREVKSPEVVWDGELYWMTWSGCDKCFQVGWAASADGLRWVAHPDPVLPAGGASWSSVATQSAFIEPRGEEWRYWYTGNDGVLQSLGVASSAAPP